MNALFVAFGGFILGAAATATVVLLAGQRQAKSDGQIYREPRKWKPPVDDEVRHRRLVAARPLTMPGLSSAAFQVPGTGDILAVYEGEPGEPGINHPHAGLSESEISIDRLPDLEAFNAWEPVPGRCALLPSSRIFRLGAKPRYPLSVLLSGVPC